MTVVLWVPRTLFQRRRVSRSMLRWSWLCIHVQGVTCKGILQGQLMLTRLQPCRRPSGKLKQQQEPWKT